MAGVELSADVSPEMLTAMGVLLAAVGGPLAAWITARGTRQTRRRLDEVVGVPNARGSLSGLVTEVVGKLSELSGRVALVERAVERSLVEGRRRTLRLDDIEHRLMEIERHERGRGPEVGNGAGPGDRPLSGDVGDDRGDHPRHSSYGIGFGAGS